MKTCSGCRRELPMDDFHRATGRSDGRQRYCKTCNTERQRAVPVEIRRDRWLRRTYGLSLADYEVLLAAQGGGCRICKTPPTADRVLVVDHDHACCPDAKKTCGQCVRGLLCDACNTALGLFQDSPERLAAAINYLKEKTS